MVFATRRLHMIAVMVCAGITLCHMAPTFAAPAGRPLSKQEKRPAPPTPTPTIRPNLTPPQREGSASSPAAPKILTPEPPIDTSVPPPLLPRASRERMRACAEEWDELKRNTKVGLPMWREFASKCLTR